MLSADTRNLRNLAKALRSADKTIYKATQASLREVGRRVAGRAAANAAYSKRIPGSLKVSASGLNSVVVKAAAPDAGPIENGGKGHVRHPVFGNREVWTDKNSHPAFLLPAAAADLRADTEAVADALTVEIEKTLHGQTGFF